MLHRQVNAWRPQAAAWIAQLANPDRGWDAIVIGEYERAFYGSQYALMARAGPIPGRAPAVRVPAVATSVSVARTYVEVAVPVSPAPSVCPA